MTFQMSAPRRLGMPNATGEEWARVFSDELGPSPVIVARGKVNVVAGIPEVGSRITGQDGTVYESESWDLTAYEWIATAHVVAQDEEDTNNA